MIKTIKVKKEMNFRELMDYILENDISDREFRCRGDDKTFRVCGDDRFDFYDKRYNIGETYEVEVEEEITEDTEFENLIWFDLKGNIHISRESNIAKIITFNDLCKKIYVYHNDEFSKIWECE